ncbi:hypothetical protein H0266_17015 [Halobacillus locisalis]|uniref:Uncharacterized protein n=2 Tax=Halobacillus locisalis TaxID=220753 RepID=A0A838CXE3_9BACI|nr:hypothetical protein [Halobacillus locisalis]
MTDDRNMYNQTQNPSHSQCQEHKNYYVLIQLNDGRQLDGIITDVTKDQIEMLVSESADDSEQRQFGGRYGYRRYRRNFFPIAGLASLALLPFIRPYPYYNPYYYNPYYYPYY